jgi:OTU domain-containing protein 3
VDADLSATAHQPKAAVARSKGGTGEDIIHAGSIKMVMAGTGCQDAEKVKQVILTCLIFFCVFFFLLYNSSFC